MTGRLGISTASDGALAIPEPGACEQDPQAAFDRLFLDHYPRVVGIIGRVVSDRTRAEELAADVFWKLYRKGRRENDSNVSGWLYRIAVRSAIDALRAASRRTRHEAAAGSEQERAAEAGHPLDDLLAEERRAQVRRVLARMRPRHARLLLLRAEGLSYDEVARAIGRNPHSVGTLLARAQDQFDRHYRALYGSPR